MYFDERLELERDGLKEMNIFIEVKVRGRDGYILMIRYRIVFIVLYLKVK